MNYDAQEQQGRSLTAINAESAPDVNGKEIY